MHWALEKLEETMHHHFVNRDQKAGKRGGKSLFLPQQTWAFLFLGSSIAKLPAPADMPNVNWFPISFAELMSEDLQHPPAAPRI